MRMRWPLPEKPRKYRLPLPRWPASGQPLFWQQKCSIGCWLAVCIAPTPCPRWPCRVTPPFSFYPPLSALLRHHQIAKNLTIQGPGAGLLTISGAGSRVFEIDGAATTVSLNGLSLVGGDGLWDYPAANGGYSGGHSAPGTASDGQGGAI